MNRAALLAVLGLCAVVAGVVARYVTPDAQLAALVLAGGGAALIAVWVAANFLAVRNALASGPGIARCSAVFRGALLLAGFIAVNLAAGALRGHVDLTARSELTLSVQTRAALGGTTRKVEAVTLFTSGTPPQIAAHARALLAEYRHVAPNITVREADPIANPELARQYRLDEATVASGVIVFDGPRGSSFVTAAQVAQGAEAAFTNAVLIASGQRMPVVYFVTGHSERAPGNGYGRAAKAMQASFLDVRELDLRTASRVPSDAAALLLIGPATPLTAARQNLLGQYLEEGGRMLVAFDPDPDPSLKAFLARRGIEVRPGYVIDRTSHAEPDETSILIPADRDAFNLGPVRLPGLAPVRPGLDMPERFAVTALAMTSPQATISGAPSRAELALPAGLLIAAPAPMATGAAAEQRLAVLGDTDFAADANIGDGANAAVLTATVHWLTAGKEVISIPPRVIGERRFLVTPAQARFVGITSIALLPFLILLIGGLVWRRRR